MVKLFEHQEEALERFLDQERFALFMEQGTGKTMVALKGIEELYNKGELDHVIIFCPKPIIYNWLLEIDRFLEVPHIIETMEYKKGKREEVFKLFHKTKFKGLKILLLNYEKSYVMKKELMKFAPDFVVMDESHKLKGRSTRTGRSIYSLTRKANYTLLMTGTPILNGLQDIFMQFKIMDDQIFGTRWSDFEAEFIIKGGYMGKEIIGYQNEEIAQNIIQEHSYRVLLEDVTELPPMKMSYHTLELSSNAQRAYNELKEEMLTRIDEVSDDVPRRKLKQVCRQNGVYYDPRERYHSLLMKAEPFINIASADLVVTQLIKLQQITGGFIIQDDGETVHIDSSKINATKELIEESTRPVLIFCRFIAEINALKEKLDVGKRVGVYRGKDQKEVYEQFQNGEIDVLILQIQSGSLGLNLQKANRIIFYSWNFSSGDYVQAIARIKRTGQKNSMEVIHLIAEDTVDEDMLGAIKVKRRISQKILMDPED